MSTKTKIQQLEKKSIHITKSRNKGFLLRNMAQDGRYIDKDGYLLSKEELSHIEKMDEDFTNNGGTAIHVMSYREPKIRT